MEVVVLCPCLQIEIALARRIGYKLGEGGGCLMFPHQTTVSSTYPLVKVDGVLAGHDILGRRTLAGSGSSHFCGANCELEETSVGSRSVEN